MSAISQISIAPGRLLESPERPGGFGMFVAGFSWGLLTAFSLASEDFGTRTMALGLAVALMISVVRLGVQPLLAWIRPAGGLLLTTHVAVACVSGWHGQSELESVLRYVALIPAFSIALAASSAGAAEVLALRVGLTLAGVAFVVFHLFHLETTALLDPRYRLNVFINTNSTAFISGMTALSTLALALQHKQTQMWRFLWSAALILCLVIWVSTKSRTAFLAIAIGSLTFLVLRFQSRVARFAIAGVLGMTVLYVMRSSMFLVDLLSLEDKHRSIQTGSGRFSLWEFVLADVWSKAPWLGVGPGNHFGIVQDGVNHSSAHNGLLMALAETGICGTVPLLALVALATWRIIHFRRDPQVSWAAGLFAAGLTESMAEVVFVSIGNPGSLLFLVSVANLLVWRPSELKGEASSATISDAIEGPSHVVAPASSH